MRSGQYFWSADGAWGTVQLCDTSLRLSVLYGDIALKCLEHPLPCASTVSLNGRPVEFDSGDGCVRFNLALKAGDVVEIWR